MSPPAWPAAPPAGVQLYPRAAATHADVIGDAALFHKTLNDLYAELGIKVQKVMKLGGQELNLHLLYQRVRLSAPRRRPACKSGVRGD